MYKLTTHTTSWTKYAIICKQNIDITYFFTFLGYYLYFPNIFLSSTRLACLKDSIICRLLPSDGLLVIKQYPIIQSK